MSNTLLVDPNRGFRVWNIVEIYQGPDVTPTGINVPNINDMVVDWNQGFFRVIAVDTAGVSPTYVPVLQVFDLSKLNKGLDTLGTDLSGYQPSASQRAFYDDSIVPFTISIDDRYRIGGSDAFTAKLFKGTDTTGNGTVISLTFNGSGNITGENIDLETLDVTNPAIKRPTVIQTNTALLEGEYVTLVVYTQEGGPVGEHTFIVRAGSAIRGVEASTISIIDIELISTLLDNVETDLIKVPANVPITGGDFQARLHYDNGDTALIAVDGTKCRLHGLDDFNTAVAGSISSVVLTYYPDNDEPLINSDNPTLRSISTIYRMQTITNNLDASFKVYVSVEWDNGNGIFVNTYYLSNVAHDIFIKLVPAQYTLTSGTVDPLSYLPTQGIQDIRIAIIINDVLGSGYNGYTFVQQIKIEYGGNAVGDNPWLLDYKGDQTGLYGASAKGEFSAGGAYPLSIKVGASTLSEWFNKIFYSIHPTYDPVTQELADLEPTHFRLEYAGYTSGDLPVSDWNVYHNHLGGIPWIEDETVTIVWLQDTVESVDHLIMGNSPIMVHGTLT